MITKEQLEFDSTVIVVPHIFNKQEAPRLAFFVMVDTAMNNSSPDQEWKDTLLRVSAADDPYIWGYMFPAELEPATPENLVRAMLNGCKGITKELIENQKRKYEYKCISGLNRQRY